MTEAKKAPAASQKAQSNQLALKTLDDLTRLAEWLEVVGLEEVELEIEGSRIRLRRGGFGTPVAYAPSYGPVAAQQKGPTPAADAAKIETVNAFKAPMVGTFYTSASPESPTFVKIGDTVKKGQVLCIIEAMKTMNQIESDRAGTVKAVLAANAMPVEFGQTLFEIA